MKKAAFCFFVSIMTILASGCGGSKESSQPQGSLKTVGCAEFEKIITETQGVRLIDVRTAKEFAEGHLAGAENKDVNQGGFGDDMELRKGRKACNVIAVYCRSGKRSLKAANILAAKGFTVYDLGGGILAWQREGKEVVK